MKSFVSIATLPLGKILYTCGLIIMFAVTALFVMEWQEKISYRRILAAGMHFVFDFLVYAVLLDLLFVGDGRTFYAFQHRLYALPWLVYALLGCISAVIMFVQLQQLQRYQAEHITPASIKETLDFLPAGVCICDDEGHVLLSNLRMDALCRTISGEVLWNAERFWETITVKGRLENTSYVVHTDAGNAWLFSREHLNSRYDQITAADVSEQYRITEELSRINSRLRDVQYRMKAVSAREAALVPAREIYRARTTVHNQLGSVLLSGKYYLDHPDQMKEEEVLRLLEFSSYFLLGEAEQPEKQPDILNEAIQTAHRIGVTVDFDGDMPENQSIRSLLGQAVNQCAANTVRHADGDHLYVKIREDEGRITFVFTNNGMPPEGPVTETGGLAGLRRAVQSAGGTMQVQSLPVFALTISLPKQSEQQDI